MRTFLLSRQKINPEKLAQTKRFRKQMTQAEIVFWKLARINKVQGLHFRRQQILDGLIADFFCNQIGLIVEIDGGIHERQKDYDKERERIISQHGFVFLRFANEEVLKKPEIVKERLDNTIASLISPSTAGKGI